MEPDESVLTVFRQAADTVPAYQQLLAEARVRPGDVRSLADFRRRVPVLDKACTFGRFPLADLCRGGEVGRPAWVLTSSGQSGRFAFGVYDAETGDAAYGRIDDALDTYFAVRSRKTLLINALPMGVKVYTRACTLAETSVRDDMVVALVKAFGRHFDQVILVAEAAFAKRILDLGRAEGVNWGGLTVHVVVGEEPLAENARILIETALGIDPARPETGRVISTMGVGELGLNLFFETPPLVALRRTLHLDAALRHGVLGPDARCVPMLFAYDPRRIFVELVDGDRLTVTMLDPTRRVPLVRYATGDRAAALGPTPAVLEAAARAGIPPDALGAMPALMVLGRGRGVRAGQMPVFPEQVKEALYAEADLASATTANFRMRSGSEAAEVLVQLAPGVAAESAVTDRFRRALSRYVRAPVALSCTPYEDFPYGMALDYERKFDYLELEPSE